MRENLFNKQREKSLGRAGLSHGKARGWEVEEIIAKEIKRKRKEGVEIFFFFPFVTNLNISLFSVSPFHLVIRNS